MFCRPFIGLFYYTLGNLEPKLRSSLKGIHLLSIAKYEHIVKYGIEELMKPVVEDVLKLEKGNNITLYNIEDMYYAGFWSRISLWMEDWSLFVVLSLFSQQIIWLPGQLEVIRL